MTEEERLKEAERMYLVDAERLSKIGELLALDAERLAVIERFQALDADRLAALERYRDLDAHRVDLIERFQALDKDRVAQIMELSARLYSMDGITVTGRNLGFLQDPVFNSAWQKSAAVNLTGYPMGVPDLRLRAHIVLWAAHHGLRLEGDFVECGVHTGLLSLVIFHALDFGHQPRNFYLFDTFHGIPLDGLEDAEIERANTSNQSLYQDVYSAAAENFSSFPNARLIRGILPQSLADVEIAKIAYLSVDLNNVNAERGVIERLWDKLVNGAIVLIDDYDWVGHELQKKMWDEFAGERGLMIASLPTGQGLLIKTE
jgi:O-methyltransferase